MISYNLASTCFSKASQSICQLVNRWRRKLHLALPIFYVHLEANKGWRQPSPELSQSITIAESPSRMSLPFHSREVATRIAQHAARSSELSAENAFVRDSSAFIYNVTQVISNGKSHPRRRRPSSIEVHFVSIRREGSHDIRLQGRSNIYLVPHRRPDCFPEKKKLFRLSNSISTSPWWMP